MSIPPAKTRVAILSPSLAPYYVPVFNRLHEIPRVDLHLVFGDGHEPAWQWDLSLGEIKFNYTRLPSIRFPFRNARGDRTSFCWSPRLFPFLRRQKFDLVVALGWTMPNTFAGWLYSKLSASAAVIWDDSIPHPPTRLKRFFLPLLTRYVGSFDGYLAGSHASMEYFDQLGAPRERVTLFPQVTDNDFFARRAAELRPQREELKRALSIHTRQVIMFVGQFIVRKGLCSLLDAFERVAAENDGVGLLFVGQGPLEEEMRARCRASAAGKRIFIHPFVPQKILPKFYSIADLFVLPSLYDTFGVVVDEAMASGLPIVTTTGVGAAADLVRDGVNGRVVAPGDSAVLAQALAQLLNDDVLLQEMSTQSSQRISTWNVDLAAEGLIRCLEICRARPVAS